MDNREILGNPENLSRGQPSGLGEKVYVLGSGGYY